MGKVSFFKSRRFIIWVILAAAAFVFLIRGTSYTIEVIRFRSTCIEVEGKVVEPICLVPFEKNQVSIEYQGNQYELKVKTISRRACLDPGQTLKAFYSKEVDLVYETERGRWQYRKSPMRDVAPALMSLGYLFFFGFVIRGRLRAKRKSK